MKGNWSSQVCEAKEGRIASESPGIALVSAGMEEGRSGRGVWAQEMRSFRGT